MVYIFSSFCLSFAIPIMIKITMTQLRTFFGRSLLFSFFLILFLPKETYAISPPLTFRDSMLLAIKPLKSDSARIIHLEKSIRKFLFSDPDKTFVCADIFDEVGQKLKSSYFQGQALNFKGISLFLQNKHGEAITYYLQALDRFEMAKDSFYIGLVNNNIGACYERTNDFQKRLVYLNKAKEYFYQIKDTVWLANTLTNLGAVYNDLKQSKEAETHHLQAIEYHKRLNNSSYLKTSYLNLSAVYERMQDFDKALKYGKMAVALVNSSDLAGDIDVMALTNLAFYYLLNEDLIQAKKYLDLATQNVHFDNLIDRQRQWEEVYSFWLEKNGNYKGALSHYKNYVTLKDSIEKQSKEQQLQEITEKYEAGKKEIELKERELALNRATQQRNWWIGIAALLLIVVGSVGIIARQRISANKQLAQLETEIQAEKIRKLEKEKELIGSKHLLKGQVAERKRLASDLHDSLGGLMTSIKAHYGSISRLKAFPNESELHHKTEQLINRSYEELRRISHDMMPPTLASSGLKPAIQQLVDQFSHQQTHYHLNIGGDLTKIEESSALFLYRILQECFQNIQKHAEASEVFVQLIVMDDQVNLSIEDDGKGFNTTAINTPTKGLGLKQLKERVHELGGEITIQSQVNEGTFIHIQCPLVVTI